MVAVCRLGMLLTDLPKYWQVKAPLVGGKPINSKRAERGMPACMHESMTAMFGNLGISRESIRASPASLDLQLTVLRRGTAANVQVRT